MDLDPQMLGSAKDAFPRRDTRTWQEVDMRKFLKVLIMMATQRHR